MSQAGIAAVRDYDALEREMRDLRARIERIEQRLEMAVEPAAPEPAAESTLPALPETAGILPALGRALLGLAGAYLLRAFSEAGTLPIRWGVAAGVAYALVWLIWAARTPAASRVEAALHSLTSALIMAPVLWESTVRLRAIPANAAGAILVLFTVFGLAVSWRKNLLVVATIATLAGLGTAAALLVGTHDVLPFTFVLLAVATGVWLLLPCALIVPL